MLLWKPLLVGDVYIGVEVGCAYHGGVKLIFWRGGESEEQEGQIEVFHCVMGGSDELT